MAAYSPKLMNSLFMGMSEQTSTPTPTRIPHPHPAHILALESPKFALNHIYSLVCSRKPKAALMGNKEKQRREDRSYSLRT